MAHNVLAQFETPDLSALDHFWVGDCDRQIRLDRRGFPRPIPQQAVEDHVNNRTVISGGCLVWVAGAEISRVDSQLQGFGLCLAARW